MKPVRFHTEAAAELEHAVSFYEARRQGLGRAFLELVERATARIQEHPQIGAPYNRTGLRRYPLQRFPYLLFYLELPDALWVVAVAHAKRRPGYWRDRSIPVEFSQEQ